MTDLSSLIWAGAVGTVSWCGHRVAITWLNHGADKAKREEERAERERGAVAELAAIRKEAHDMRTEQKTFLANARAR